MKANKGKSKKEEKKNQMQGLLKPQQQGRSGGAGADEGSGKRVGAEERANPGPGGDVRAGERHRA